QIKASRGMQMLQPEMQAIQKKYKGKTDPASREAMSRETMELYRKHGTNPFASCMPILRQSPIFFALFRVLNGLVPISNGTDDPIGPIDASVASDIESSSVFGAQLSDIFLRTDDLQTRIVIGVLILAMCATTFFTQRQLTMKNMPKAALEGPMASTQEMMLSVSPFIFAVSGVSVPVGVLVYRTTTNLWAMAQQLYTIRRMRAPRSEAEPLFKERQARKRAAKGVVEDATPVIEQPRGQRQQPKRKDRQKTAPRPVGTVSATTPEDAPVEDAPADKPAPGGAAKGGSGTGASKP